jgi:hypothetical protein
MQQDASVMMLACTQGQEDSVKKRQVPFHIFCKLAENLQLLAELW